MVYSEAKWERLWPGNIDLGQPKFHVPTQKQFKDTFKVTEQSIHKSRHFVNTLAEIYRQVETNWERFYQGPQMLLDSMLHFWFGWKINNLNILNIYPRVTKLSEQMQRTE